jgi:hypothetical protein
MMMMMMMYIEDGEKNHETMRGVGAALRNDNNFEVKKATSVVLRMKKRMAVFAPCKPHKTDPEACQTVRALHATFPFPPKRSTKSGTPLTVGTY